jgi:hypothetical protein
VQIEFEGKVLKVYSKPQNVPEELSSSSRLKAGAFRISSNTTQQCPISIVLTCQIGLAVELYSCIREVRF